MPHQAPATNARSPHAPHNTACTRTDPAPTSQAPTSQARHTTSRWQVARAPHGRLATARHATYSARASLSTCAWSVAVVAVMRLYTDPLRELTTLMVTAALPGSAGPAYGSVRAAVHAPPPIVATPSDARDGRTSGQPHARQWQLQHQTQHQHQHHRVIRCGRAQPRARIARKWAWHTDTAKHVRRAAAVRDTQLALPCSQQQHGTTARQCDTPHAHAQQLPIPRPQHRRHQHQPRPRTCRCQCARCCASAHANSSHAGDATVGAIHNARADVLVCHPPSLTLPHDAAPHARYTARARQVALRSKPRWQTHKPKFIRAASTIGAKLH